MGLSTDSIRARDTWVAVLEQSNALRAMFSPRQLQKLEEIR